MGIELAAAGGENVMRGDASRFPSPGRRPAGEAPTGWPSSMPAEETVATTPSPPYYVSFLWERGARSVR
jgi:hypothetical protein